LKTMRQPISHAVLTFIVALILGCIQTARADELSAAYSLRHQWAVAKYKTDKNNQLAILESLIDNASDIAEKNPNNPEVLLWQGTILSTYANLKGGMSVLKIIDAAKVDLEKSIGLDETVDGGLAHAILGAMYYRVPGWPISFKDYDAAEYHLTRALALNPNSIDAHFFYGDFLRHRGESQKAAIHFKAALELPVRASHEVEDEGRHQEALDALGSLS
jgi:tetratricopeptide (TPR) repeat protein